jgi:hypothetical protein
MMPALRELLVVALFIGPPNLATGRGANHVAHRCEGHTTTAAPILTAAAPSNCLQGAGQLYT